MGGTFTLAPFANRSAGKREKLLREHGGGLRSEKAVADGLRFLALHQCPDGHWSLHQFQRFARTAPLPAGRVVPDNCDPMTKRNNDTGGTAFGLLPFLAAGITHQPRTPQKPADYSKTVARGLDWLLARQSKAGNDRGYFGGDMYGHALATAALCEAYGLTSDPRLRASAQAALNYLVLAQDPAGGGWRYTPRMAGDTSVTVWVLAALKAGQMAGLGVPAATLRKAAGFLDACEVAGKGGYGYLPGSPETPTLTAAGALCRQRLGVNPQSPSLLGSAERIRKSPPGPGGLYYEYHATQVMFHQGGEDWRFWNLGPDGTGKGGVRDTLLARQDTGGREPGQAGSFPGDDHVGGRLGATSMSLLTLQVYYRYAAAAKPGP